jgi:RHH-type proline utilization regulon transcriptional repressor/proline dehydrogenase/delta 1-pyrroline-5-carboxylate dehydrogenase
LGATDVIYAQFATHNAHTLSVIYTWAKADNVQNYEFQCLHGMGETLYDQVVGAKNLDKACRIYAPVGSHETLLAYLVRRLLENGANSSFVNQIVDESVPIETLLTDPFDAARAANCLPHPRIPLPQALYPDGRKNSSGLDLANEDVLAALAGELGTVRPYVAAPLIDGQLEAAGAVNIVNPAQSADIVGHITEATVGDVDTALGAAVAAAPAWEGLGNAARADILLRVGDLFEQHQAELMALAVREAGKSLPNAIAEIREAVDFLRYYAAEIRSASASRALGPVTCISPWNFPLAIFTGQVAAALAAGNTVLAKPAEQTPLIAAQAVQILLDAGVPAGVLQLLPGQGETVGAQLTGDERVRGVMFTGSTAVATLLQRNLAGRLDPQGRPTPLIAETGGMNAMIVDSSALTEQVVVDIVASAFDSAGQRCSALRLLCIQEDAADHTIKMLRGAMAECRMGNPERLSTDIGPVIDQEAKAGIERHIQAMRNKGFTVYQAVQENAQDRKEWESGTFIKPTLIELDQVSDLDKEIFGPVLHVVRFSRSSLPQLIEQINATGYGLTLGVHTRIDETIAQVTANAHVGNLYVNRNMVGAVVGVQPFGGEGLSGTGPKAGGPLYLYRLLAHRPDGALRLTFDRQDAEQPVDSSVRTTLMGAHQALQNWAQDKPALQALCQRYDELSQAGTVRLLPGPTGERNTFSLLPRERVLCLADNEQDALIQLAAVTSVGSQALWQDDELHRALLKALPPAVQQRIRLAKDALSGEFDAVIYHGDADQLRTLCADIAAREGAIVSVQGFARGETNLLLERLLIERSLSVNTAAAGGNASLMTIG